MEGFLNNLINSLVSVLPADPFIESINGFAENFGSYLSTVNYFVPFYLMAKVLIAWIACVTVWYLWRALASYLHLIG